MPRLSRYFCWRWWAPQTRDWLEKSVKCDLVLPRKGFLWIARKALWRVTHDHVLLEQRYGSDNWWAIYFSWYSWNWFRCNVAFSAIKKKKLWIIKAVDHCTGRTLAWVLGGRDAATFQRLYDKVKHLKDCLFSTDNWEAFAQVLPKDRHVIGTASTSAIERDNANTRHHLARLTRKTKVVSQSEDMVHASLKLWCALNVPAIFEKYQEIFLSLFIWTLSSGVSIST